MQKDVLFIMIIPLFFMFFYYKIGNSTFNYYKYTDLENSQLSASFPFYPICTANICWNSKNLS